MKNISYNLMSEMENHWWYAVLDDLVIKNIKGCTLDVGCGSGRLLRKTGGKGIDISEESERLCGGLNFEKMGAESLSEAEKYDTITCLDVIYHRWADEDKILKNLYRALKPKGLLILNLPAFNCLKRGHDKLVMGERRYTKDFNYKLVEYGFTVELSAYRLPMMFLSALVSKVLKIEEDMFMPPKWANCLLKKIGIVLNKIIMNGGFPFGSSLFIIAKKRKLNRFCLKQFCSHMKL